MPQTSPIQPKRPVVIGSGKDREKGFYRDIRMPNGVVRREWSLFSDETKQRHKEKQDTFNDKVGWASAPGLTKIGGAMMATGAAAGAGAFLLAKKTPELAAKYAARQREKSRINPVVKRAGPIHHILSDTRDKTHKQTVTKGQIKRTGNFAGGKGTRPAPQQRMSLTRQQYNARLDPRLGGQSSSLLGGQSSPSLRGQSSTFTPSTAAQREEAIQAMQIRKHGSPLQGQSTNLTAVREEAIQAMQIRKHGSPLQGQTSPLPARGSTMPQTGNLFDQPSGPTYSNERILYGKPGKPIGARVSSGDRIVRNPVESSTKKAGTRYAPAGTAKATGKGTRGVPRPAPRSSGKPTGSAPKTQMGQGIAVNRNPKSAAELKAIEDGMRRRSAARAGTGAPGARFRSGPVADSPGAMRAESAAGIGKPRATFRPVGNPTKLVGPGIAVNRNPLSPEEMAKIARAQNAGGKPGVRFRPVGSRAPGFAVNRSPKSPAELKAIEDAMRARRAGIRATNTPRPTPQFGPTPTGTKPYVPPGQSAIPTFTTTAPKKLGFWGKYGRTAGKIGSVIATAVGASELYDQLAPKNAPRAPWMSGGDKKAPPAQAPAATAPAPAQSGGNKPAGGQKPYEPTYFPEAGNNGNAVRKPDSYLGEAFDYSLQKGTTSGTKYLEHMFRRDKVSEDDQQRLRERFNKKVVGDQTLKEYGADKGITETVEGKTPGLGKALLEKYRDTGTYQGNTDYGKMRAAAETRMARK